jgi:hypothetical protein
MDEQTARELNVVVRERELLKATKVIVAALMDVVARAFNLSENYMEVADELDRVASRLRVDALVLRKTFELWIGK